MQWTTKLSGITLLLAAFVASGPLGAEATLDCSGGSDGGAGERAMSGAVLPTDDVVLPRSITKVEPRYPESARVSRIEGKVILQVIVDRGGRVGGSRS